MSLKGHISEACPESNRPSFLYTCRCYPLAGKNTSALLRFSPLVRHKWIHLLRLETVV